MFNEIRLDKIPFNSLIKNLSYDEFFNRYDPWKDGKVIVSSYSFTHERFDFWSKLKPESVFYISDNYRNPAQQFIKRFPWFEVYVIPKLHAKVVFFEKSGVLLVGSENLYDSQSCFFEVMMETAVSKEQRDEVVEFLFKKFQNIPLRCTYDEKDIKIYKQGEYPEGTLCLPSNLEIHHSELIVGRFNINKDQEENLTSTPGKLYAIFEYVIQGEKYYLGMNRGYHYCGDLSINLVNWILKNVEIEETVSDYSGGFFPSYHPVPKNRIAQKVYFLGKVINHTNFEKLKISPHKNNISTKIILKKDSWQSYFNQ